MVGITKFDDREECGEDKEVSDAIRELALVDKLRIDEAARHVLLISENFYIITKVIIPMCQTPYSLVSHV